MDGSVFSSNQIGVLIARRFITHITKVITDFYAPGVKGLPGTSSNRIVHLFVRLSVMPSHSQSQIIKVKVVKQ